MIARMRSMMGWLRRLGYAEATPVRARKRHSHVPSVFDSLEHRQVLSTATFSPFLMLPGTATPATLAPTTVTTTTATTLTSTAIPATSAAPYLAYVYPQANGAPSVVVPTATTSATAATTPGYAYGQPVVQAPTIAPIVSAQASTAGYAVSSVSANPQASYIQSLYHNVLGRTGTTAEVAAWVTEMNSGQTLKEVALGFIDSVEHRQDEVNIFYAEFLHKTPDAVASDWVASLVSGISDQAVAEAILDSPNFQAAHPDSASFIQGLYTDVLGRTAGPNEVAGWQAVLAGGESRQAVVAEIVQSPEAIDNAVESFYEDFLGREPNLPVSNGWVAMLARGDSTSDVAAGILSSVEYLQDTTQA